MKNLMLKIYSEITAISEYLLTGALSSLAYAIYKRKKMIDAIRSVVVGGLSAEFITPLITQHINISPAFAGYVVGLSGVGISEWLIKSFPLIKAFLAQPSKQNLPIK